MTEDRSAAAGRVYYLDWLRAGAMAAVFLFHCGRAFDSEGWHIKSDETTLGFSIFSLILVQWMMPMFFLISGWVSFLNLQRLETGAFVVSRTKRLLVPLVAGTLILVPHQVYIERVTQGGVKEGFLSWLPRYFDGFYAFGGNFAWMGLHLWYLEMLFLFSLLLLPILLRFRSPGTRTDASAVLAWLTGALVLLAVELFVDRFPTTLGRRDFGGWSPLTYIVWFLLGYFVGRSAGLQRALTRAWHGSLVVAAIGLAFGFAIVLGGVELGYVAERVVRVAVAWGGVAAFLGYAARSLNRDAAWRRSINEGILPFYLLHQSVIVLVDYFVLPLPMAPIVKFVLVALVSLAVILASYLLLVRPFGPVRFLFGMPPRAPAS